MQSIAKVGSPFCSDQIFVGILTPHHWLLGQLSQEYHITYRANPVFFLTNKTSEEIHIPQSFTFLSKAFYKRLATDVMQATTILLRYNLTSHIERLKRFIHLGHSLKTSGIQSPWSDWHYVGSYQSRTLYLCITHSGI